MSGINDLLATKGYVCNPLNLDHFLMDFECGHGEVLADWLRDHAHPYQKEELCRVWVMSPLNNTEAVLGYFTLSSHVMIFDHVNKRDRFIDPLNGNRVHSLPRLPAQLLGKFAIDTNLQGTGLASLMMLAAYGHFLEGSKHAASKYLAVEAKDQKVADYYAKQYGFVQSAKTSKLYTLYRPSVAIQEDVKKAILPA